MIHSTSQADHSAENNLPADHHPAPAANPVTDTKLKQAAESFEGMFIKQMLHQMRKTTQSLSNSDSIFNQQINADMLDWADLALADQLAKQHSFGIANAIMHQLTPPAPAATNIGNNTINPNQTRVAIGEHGSAPSIGQPDTRPAPSTDTQ